MDRSLMPLTWAVSRHGDKPSRRHFVPYVNVEEQNRKQTLSSTWYCCKRDSIKTALLLKIIER